MHLHSNMVAPTMFTPTTIIPTTVGLATITTTSFSHLNANDVEVRSKCWWTLKTSKANMNVNLNPNWKSRETLSWEFFVKDIPCFHVFLKMLQLMLLRSSSCNNSLFFFEHQWWQQTMAMFFQSVVGVTMMAKKKENFEKKKKNP